jgi:hypothetical protein
VIVDAASGRELGFTSHALVRFVERHLDRDAVERLRRRGLADVVIARSLAAPFGAKLDSFRAEARTRARRSMRSRAIANIPFRLKFGGMRIVIDHGRCVTVLPADRATS